MSTEIKYRIQLPDPTTDPKIACPDKGKTMIFLNPKRESYCKIHVDVDDFISGERCDYMLVRQYDNAEEYYVELKGTDITHAISQLRVTIDRLGLETKQLKRVAFIIASRISPKFNTRIQLGEKTFRQKYNAELIVKGHSHYEYSLNESGED